MKTLYNLHTPVRCSTTELWETGGELGHLLGSFVARALHFVPMSNDESIQSAGKEKYGKCVPDGNRNHDPRTPVGCSDHSATGRLVPSEAI